MSDKECLVGILSAFLPSVKSFEKAMYCVSIEKYALGIVKKL